ncbi:hypothetical protein BsWGS_11707 [Bradybaena similaris]
MHSLQLQTIAAVLGTCLAWLPTSLAQDSELPNECERGVKRHHPSQANVYQVFTRQDYRKQWLDYTCPEYTIFDPSLCQCVDSLRQDPHRHKQRPVPLKSKTRQRRPEPQRHVQAEGKEASKVYQVENDRADDVPKSGWPPQEKSSDWSQQQRKQETWTQQQSPKGHHTDPIYEIKQEVIQRRDKQGSSNQAPSKQKEDTDCYLHRETGNPSLFERWSDGQWMEEDCNWPFYTGLVWSQASCRCVWGPNRTVAVPNAEDSIPATCLLMLKMTFDNGHIKDEGRHIWLNVRNKENAVVENDSTAVGGKCGSFRGSSIAIPYFKSNVLGDIFHIGFMFKLCPGDPDTDIPLVHNDCIESGEDGPGIMVTYQAWRKQVIVSMRTVNSPLLVSEYCTVGKAQNDWTKIDIRYSNNFLEVRANNEVCVESNKFYGVIATNNCPLTLLGEAFCGSLDEIVITRGCTSAHAVS